MAAPSRHAVTLILRFCKNHSPDEADIHRLAREPGFRIAEGSTSIALKDGQLEWHLVFISQTSRNISIPSLAEGLRRLAFLEDFQVAFARN